MKADRLNRALTDIDDRFLDMADFSEKEIRQMHMKTRTSRNVLRTILIAAALTALFTLTAYAIGSIHAARQEALRQDLQIDESKTDSYMEYDFSTEPGGGVTLLSAINDGQEQKIYLNASPITGEEIESFPDGGLRFGWQVEGSDFSGFAAPRLPSDLTLSGRDEIVEAIRQYAYDSETETLTLECWIAMPKLREIMEARGTDRVDLSRYMNVQGGEPRCLGTVPFTPTAEERRDFDFHHAIYHDPELDKEIEIVGLELTPISAVWKVHYEGDAEFHTPNVDWDAYHDWAVLEDKVCIETQLIFSDGSSFSTGGALMVPYENGTVNQYCAWERAIDIGDVQKIVLGDLVLWET